MPEDYYSGGSEGSEAPSPATAESKEPKGDENGEETTTVPKSMLGGKEFNPGDELVLKVVHVYEDEVEVAYAKEEKPKSEMDKADEDMGMEMPMGRPTRRPARPMMGAGM